MILKIIRKGRSFSLEKLLDRMEINKGIMGERAGSSKIKQIKQ